MSVGFERFQNRVAIASSVITTPTTSPRTRSGAPNKGIGIAGPNCGSGRGDAAGGPLLQRESGGRSPVAVIVTRPIVVGGVLVGWIDHV